MKEINLKVEGMSCSGCENRIINSVSLIDGVVDVKASHHDGTVKVILNKDSDINVIKNAIQDIGFNVINE